MVRLRKCELLEHQDFFFDKGTQYFVHKHCHRFLFMAMVIRDNGIGITHGLVFTTFAPDHHGEESHLFLTPAGCLNFIRLKASVILMLLVKACIPGHSRGQQYIDRSKGTELTERYLYFGVLFQK